MHSVQKNTPPEAGGLLRLLFVRHGALSQSTAGCTGMLLSVSSALPECDRISSLHEGETMAKQKKNLDIKRQTVVSSAPPTEFVTFTHHRRFPTMKLIAHLALALLILGLLFLLVSGNFFSPSPFVIAGQFLAVALSGWARQTFQAGQFNIQAEPKEGPLMSSGPYRFVRHPMYSAALLLLWSTVLGHLSVMTVSVGIIVTGGIMIRIIVEEEALRGHFSGYAEYAGRTKRIIPFVI